MGDDIKLRVSKIEKSFPGVKALDKIDFTVRKGTVHALCGENGAGKSTLMKIINGIYKPDAGEIFVDEKSVKIKDPIMARSLGIAMIAQELNYVPEMSVEENIFLGRLPVDGMGRVKWREVREKTERLLKEEHLPYKATDKLKTLTTSDIQMLEILKAISNDASIVVMDEPTSSITQKEVELLFKKIALLKAKGCAIVYISHKMDEVFEICDQISVSLLIHKIPPTPDGLSKNKAGNQRICKRPEGKLFDLAVNQYNSNTAEDASINGKPALIDLKNGEKVILVLLPLKKHIVCSGTENTHGNQSKHEII